MAKRSILGLVFAGMFVLLVALWVRVRQLEQAVNSLTPQLQPQSRMLTVPVREPVQRSNEKMPQIFRLIESSEKYTEPVKGPFHPDVDRAMMIDAIQRTGPVQGIDPVYEPSVQIEVSPHAVPMEIPNSNSQLESIKLFRNAD
jgi:hypothetical protein